jgi:hypothetical protein
MNANTIFLIIQLLIFFLFVSCLIVGDTYLTYMVFNSRSYVCESFDNTQTIASDTTVTTALPTQPTSQYSSCYNLTNTQLGFARFKIIAFWVLLVCITGVSIYMFAKLYSQNQVLFGFIIAVTLIMTIFIITGGVLITQYGFAGSNKNCIMPTENATAPQIKSTKYCYNLNSTELIFAKIAVVFGWMYSFAAIITIGLFIWEANLG